MSAMTKAERLNEMKRLYIQRAFTDMEMSERLDVDRSTVYRDRMELTVEYPIEQDAEGRYHIDRVRLISEIKVNLHEALALYLSARKTSRQTRFHQPHTASALEKLAAALRQPMTGRLLKAAEILLKQEQDSERVKILEILAKAWVEQKKVRIRYQRLDSQDFINHVISPYLIEPSLWSDSVYVIALSDVTEKIIPFKIDRIETAVLSGEGFELPAKFDDQEMLRHAWGIWFGDKAPVTVRLRFNRDVTRRVKESIWHPLERVTDLPDGGCEWSAEIAEWREMLPWVRGWGADVEVLEPESLRKALEREVRRMARLYKVVVDNTQNLFYAHTKDGADKSEWQRLVDHLNNTAKMAADLGKDAEISELARIAGLAHDLGKYSLAFQRRLDGAKYRVDHATAGAQEIWKLYGQTQKWQALILAYAIAGHHGGLPDYGSLTDVGGEGTLLARRNPEKTKLQDYSAYKTEIDISSLSLPALALKRTQNMGFSCSFLTRMLYSTLVDADWLETETFCNEGEKPRGGYESIEILNARFNNFLHQFDHPQTAINQKRSETLNACLAKSDLPQGIFTLTIPTGGGKTLASMAFALNHAVKHGLKRIVYVIPFTSIIEQNAAVFKGCLGEENVLEHHSNFDWEQVKRRASLEGQDDETNQADEKLKLAAENWDIPIIVTTNVQFFESLFANKKSRCRKLHNLAKSVIIFDEAQTLPREFMKPCMLALQELILNYGASAVFCTATQPILKQFMPEMPDFTELVPDTQGLFNFYKRVQVKQSGTLTDDELLECIHAHEQALCIVNTRKHAKGLFDKLADNGRFHLSTLMCPAHRKTVLLEVRNRLKNGEPCRVVSTQVMEAGIDVDFPVGFRALAGLDSIIQAAGRVNREGQNPQGGEMFVFEPDTKFIKRTPTFIKQTAEAARSILREHGADPASMAAIRAYFSLLDVLQDSQRSADAKEILTHLNRNDGFDFKTAAEKFKLIDNNTVAVIIPYNDEARELIKKLAFMPHPTKILRQLQSYTVNIYEREFEALNVQGVIEMAADAYPVLNDMSFYDEKTGISLPASDGGAAIFFD